VTLYLCESGIAPYSDVLTALCESDSGKNLVQKSAEQVIHLLLTTCARQIRFSLFLRYLCMHILSYGYSMDSCYFFFFFFFFCAETKPAEGQPRKRKKNKVSVSGWALLLSASSVLLSYTTCITVLHYVYYCLTLHVLCCIVNAMHSLVYCVVLYLQQLLIHYVGLCKYTVYSKHVVYSADTGTATFTE